MRWIAAGIVVPTRCWALSLGLGLLLWPQVGAARMQEHHSAPVDSTMHRPRPARARAHPMSHAHHGMAQGTMGHEMPMGREHPMHMEMAGIYGPYPMTREASGTSWQPDDAHHEGVHLMRGRWTAMLHGMADLLYDRQGGPRGDEKAFSTNMLMGMARRPLGPGTVGLRAMLSAEPATVGREGYPLLLQTGETANGRTPLVDRQHPHDLFMELAGAYSISRGAGSIFLYGGLPGEPALGPPAYMHRYSGMNIPVAPLTHHWLDSTHITYGVLTVGAVLDRVKVEASAFRGREPDQDRWNLESPRLDSHSFRLSVNPAAPLALQVSHGRLKEPEPLEPGVDQDRTTASAICDGRWSNGHWEATLAWGRDRNRPGHILDGFAAEAAAEWAGRHTVFARAERVEKDELFLPPDARTGEVFDVGELTAGYRFDWWRAEHLGAGIGVAGTLSRVPRELRDAYGESPAAGLVFVHAAIR